ncbi:6002_t:CDS:2 [Gigaspora rosea]|nr:6002_t:CDS:2 [Gigaspora rosea]
MISIVFCFIVLFLLIKLFEKALDENLLYKNLEENKDHGTENDVFKVESIHEEMLDKLIFFVRENNKKLEWLSHDTIYVEDGEVAALVEELAELIKDQQEKIARCLFHQQLEENNILINEFKTIERKASRFNLKKPVQTS